jgi:lysophospholipase L1-like esterase
MNPLRVFINVVLMFATTSSSFLSTFTLVKPSLITLTAPSSTPLRNNLLHDKSERRRWQQPRIRQQKQHQRSGTMYPIHAGDDILSEVVPITTCNNKSNLLLMDVSNFFGLFMGQQHCYSLVLDTAMDNIYKIQRIGESVFTGLSIVAVIQGAIALGAYRKNPRGELIVPPGKTIGIAHPRHSDHHRQQSMPMTAKRNKNTTLATASRSNSAATTTSTTTSAVAAPTKRAMASTLSEDTGRYSRIVGNVNKWLVVILPWVSRQLSYVLGRNTHFFHLAFIVTITRIFDFPHYFLSTTKQNKKVASMAARTKPQQFQRPSHINTATTTTLSSDTDSKTTTTLLSNQRDKIQNIIVIGDSLAIGLGSADTFDSNKNNTLDFQLIQNVGPDDNRNLSDSIATSTGPIFPRVLAETIAQIEGHDVHWRSAGVDGGDTQHVHDFCLPVVEEEVKRGRVPQVVVLLVGVNDLKYFMSKPWLGGNPGPRIFQRRLKDLIDSIHKLAPGCMIVLPAAQMFHRNSPINIFPFNIVMDALIGFWESLKIGVADRVVDGEDLMTPSSTAPNSKGRVIYVRMDPQVILQWYDQPNPLLGDSDYPSSAHSKEERLIASDGVHPNAKCYALWAQNLAKFLLSNRSIAATQITI